MYVPVVRYPGSFLDDGIMAALKVQDTAAMNAHTDKHSLMTLCDASLGGAALSLDGYLRGNYQYAQLRAAERAEIDNRRTGPNWDGSLNATVETWTHTVDARNPRVVYDPSREVEHAAMRAHWNAGAVSRSYIRNLPHYFASDFVAALHMLGRGIAALSQQHGTLYDKAFPALKHVRDSDQHADERVQFRGKTSKGKIGPMKPQPMNSHGIDAPNGGVLIVGGLFGDEYTWTAADGSTVGVEVSENNLRTARDLYQDVVNSFKWTGSPRWEPRN